MSKQVQQIKAEIERRKKLISDTCQGVIMSQRNIIEYEVYKELLYFIDSLQEEPVSEDLEEAAREAASLWYMGYETQV